jgi:phospholipid/cholesterol/gamma-HCH transport system substrate-binding protein
MRRNHRRGMSNVTAGVITLVLVAVGTYLGFTKSIPFRHHYTVSAVFRSANNVKKNSPVRIAGVNVGKVTKVDADPDDPSAAVVTMRIDKQGLPLHSDATFAVRPRIFLEGNFFVDVSPGSPSAPVIGDGATIPINQTRSPVQLDQVLTSLQSDTRKNLQLLLDELSTGVDKSGGKGFNESIKYWEPAYKNGAIVADAQLGEQPHDLSGYLASASQVAAALDRDPAKLASLITDFNTTANAFARQQGHLSSAIAELPRTLHAGMPALAALNRSFPHVRAFVKDFRPGVRSSRAAIAASTPLVQQLRGLVQPSELRGLVADLRPTVPSLTRLTTATKPLYEQVGLASSCQNDVILPWTHDTIDDPTFPAVGPVYVESTKPFGGLAGESRSGDANGQWFRVLLTGGNYTYPDGANGFLQSTFPLMGVNPPKPATGPQYRPDVPCETQQSPDLRTIPTSLGAGHKVNVTDVAGYQQVKDRAAQVLQRSLDTQKLTGQDAAPANALIQELGK